MKKALVVLLSLLLLVSFSACRSVEQIAGGIASEIAAELLSGDVEGTVGKTYSTQWFSFSIDSIERTSEYKGYAAGQGNELIKVEISEANIFSEAIPMGTSDFYLDAGSFEDYSWPLSPYDDGMMPDEFELGVDEKVQYVMIYEVPAELTDLTLHYTEYDEAENVGATFTIKVPK